jgi:hypothetical protein
MVSNALEAITNFITSRNLREGETFSFASLQIRYPDQNELLAVLAKMGEEGLIEDMSAGCFKLTGTGYVKYFGAPPSEDDTIKAIMSEISARGVKAGRAFHWMPLQERLELKRFRTGDLKPALEKIFNNHWLENTPTSGFFKLTEAGLNVLKTIH